ncbi:MAG: ExbD/TolR family protein [Oligoflexus sp.]
MAGGANLGDEDETISSINVTPFVDVMLVLLIIFMVTANYLNSQSINLDLPQAATGEATENSAASLGFSINKDSEIFLDGKPLDIEELPTMIAARREGGESLQALIAADQATPHGAVIKLIDIVRKNGITDFAINVEVEAQ